MLTPAQLVILKNDIATNTNTVDLAGVPTPISATPNTGDVNNEIKNWYNQLFSPSYWAWRTNVNKHEYTQQAGVDTDGVTVTNFVWGGATGGYIARSQGERDAFKELFNSTLSCKPSLANVRTAFDDIFSGAGAGAVANRAHLKAVSRRIVTRAERLFVVATVGGPTQTGSRGITTNPDTMVFEGALTLADVTAARDLP